MTLGPPYPKPPIIEAVIDIRIEGGASSFNAIDALRVPNYPNKKPRVEYHGALTFGPQVASTTSQRHLGFAFVDESEKQIFQARIDGFTFGRLAPYSSWGEVKAEAQRLWTLYKDTVKPEKITRIAVRYINRLDLPFPFDDFKDFLRTFPEVSPGISQELSTFLMSFDSPQADISALLKLNMTPVPPPSESVVSIMLDIDLIKLSNLPQLDTDLWAEFELLRTRKNAVFEACITDKARELFY